MDVTIRVHDLCRDYVVRSMFSNKTKRVVKALNGINFEVKKGEIFGILGPNGAGKTTTIKILATLLLPTSGTAKVFGYDVEKHPIEIRKRINLVMGGERNLYQRLTALENMEYFAELYNVPLNIRKKRIYDLLGLAGLQKERWSDKVETYSKGMKQRLQIARGLINDPDCLFLDEPTIGLDPIGARELKNIVKTLTRMGKTIIFTTHYMQEADELCDRVAILNKGTIVTIGTPTELKKTYTEKFQIDLTLTFITHDHLEHLQNLKHVNYVRVNELEKKTHLFIDTQACSEAVESVFNVLHGIPIQDVSIKKSTLEDVYVKLLGGEH
ncbi:MAG: ABC transporter ATP-binding protein [Athalassotoga sp.]|uniref:ABC transporter ATP-binding protein n=1 Tax=Athalassotoga sp. TaxID=2022597 RepID=UPI003D067957